MTKPDFVAQTAEPLTGEERIAWFRERAIEAYAEGVTRSRFSIHPELAHLTLYEGWIEAADDVDDPHFQLTRQQAQP